LPFHCHLLGPTMSQLLTVVATLIASSTAQRSYELCRGGSCCLTARGAPSCNINGWTLGFTETPFASFSGKGPDNSLQYTMAVVPTPGSSGQWTGKLQYPGTQTQGCSGNCGNSNPLCDNSGSCTCTAHANLDESVQVTKQSSAATVGQAKVPAKVPNAGGYHVCRGSDTSDCCISEPGSTSCRTARTGLELNFDAGTSTISAQGPVVYSLNLMHSDGGIWTGTFTFSSSYVESCSFDCDNWTWFCSNDGHCSARVSESAKEVVSVQPASVKEMHSKQVNNNPEIVM